MKVIYRGWYGRTLRCGVERMSDPWPPGLWLTGAFDGRRTYVLGDQT
jgi:hypothetical protein